ncbi:MAG: RHS repeat-associated core domain-containing protein [Lachnospiraceae bacterium]|nr:RHS repeat-associated core domain-containing protein [Lachnospiraceae bacterium]
MSSITHVVDSEAGEILNRYEYDAWGNLTTCEEIVHNRFKFNGQQLDPITQQYYLRARYYNPVIGRFTQQDTYRGDGLNLYVYCANNPIYYIDPSGHLICQNIANAIIDKLNNNNATRNEQKKLVAFLRTKSKHDKLTDEEQKALNKIAG